MQTIRYELIVDGYQKENDQFNWEFSQLSVTLYRLNITNFHTKTLNGSLNIQEPLKMNKRHFNLMFFIIQFVIFFQK